MPWVVVPWNWKGNVPSATPRHFFTEATMFSGAREFSRVVYIQQNLVSLTETFKSSNYASVIVRSLVTDSHLTVGWCWRRRLKVDIVVASQLDTAERRAQSHLSADRQTDSNTQYSIASIARFTSTFPSRLCSFSWHHQILIVLPVRDINITKTVPPTIFSPITGFVKWYHFNDIYTSLYCDMDFNSDSFLSYLYRWRERSRYCYCSWNWIAIISVSFVAHLSSCERRNDSRNPLANGLHSIFSFVICHTSNSHVRYNRHIQPVTRSSSCSISDFMQRINVTFYLFQSYRRCEQYYWWY